MINPQGDILGDTPLPAQSQSFGMDVPSHGTRVNPPTPNPKRQRQNAPSKRQSSFSRQLSPSLPPHRPSVAHPSTRYAASPSPLGFSSAQSAFPPPPRRPCVPRPSSSCAVGSPPFNLGIQDGHLPQIPSRGAARPGPQHFTSLQAQTPTQYSSVPAGLYQQNPFPAPFPDFSPP